MPWVVIEPFRCCVMLSVVLERDTRRQKASSFYALMWRSSKNSLCSIFTNIWIQFVSFFSLVYSTFVCLYTVHNVYLCIGGYIVALWKNNYESWEKGAKEEGADVLPKVLPVFLTYSINKMSLFISIMVSGANAPAAYPYIHSLMHSYSYAHNERMCFSLAGLRSCQQTMIIFVFCHKKSVTIHSFGFTWRLFFKRDTKYAVIYHDVGIGLQA